jgi:hypothetical protein
MRERLKEGRQNEGRRGGRERKEEGREVHVKMRE